MTPPPPIHIFTMSTYRPSEQSYPTTKAFLTRDAAFLETSRYLDKGSEPIFARLPSESPKEHIEELLRLGGNHKDAAALTGRKHKWIFGQDEFAMALIPLVSPQEGPLLHARMTVQVTFAGPSVDAARTRILDNLTRVIESAYNNGSLTGDMGGDDCHVVTYRTEAIVEHYEAV